MPLICLIPQWADDVVTVTNLLFNAVTFLGIIYLLSWIPVLTKHLYYARNLLDITQRFLKLYEEESKRTQQVVVDTAHETKEDVVHTVEQAAEYAKQMLTNSSQNLKPENDDKVIP